MLQGGGAIPDNMRHFQYRLIHHTNFDFKKKPCEHGIKIT